MKPDEFLDLIRRQVMGRPVTFRRLSANSLLVYVDAEPGDGKGVLFWFEPTWHLRGPDRVLTGSRQAQEGEGAADPQAGFEAAARAVDALLGRTVTAVEVEAVTHSLVLRLSGDYEVRTFVSDPTSDLDWHIDDRAARVSLEGCAAGLEVVGMPGAGPDAAVTAPFKPGDAVIWWKRIPVGPYVYPVRGTVLGLTPKRVKIETQDEDGTVIRHVPVESLQPRDA